jgi:hypothetical protein
MRSHGVRDQHPAMKIAIVVLIVLAWVLGLLVALPAGG